MSLTDIYHPVNMNKTKSSLPYCVKKSIYKCGGVNFSLMCKYVSNLSDLLLRGSSFIRETSFYQDSTETSDCEA